MKKWKISCLVVGVMAVLAAGVVEAASEAVPRDRAYLKVREQLADVMASEEFDKVEFAAASFDDAMALIYTTAETYLDQAVPALGGVETARTFGVAVLQGLDDHTIHWDQENGYDLVGKGRLLISNQEDAKQLGELLARVAILIHSAHGGIGVDIRRAARKIFEAMLPVQGSGQPLVTQYLVRLRTLSKADRKELLAYALE